MKNKLFIILILLATQVSLYGSNIKTINPKELAKQARQAAKKEYAQRAFDLASRTEADLREYEKNKARVRAQARQAKNNK